MDDNPLRAGPIVAGVVLLLIGLRLSLVAIGIPIAFIGFIMTIVGLFSGEAKVTVAGSGQQQAIVTPAAASYQQAPERPPQQPTGSTKLCNRCGQTLKPTDVLCPRCGQRTLPTQGLVRVGEELDKSIASGARLVRYLSDGKQAIVERTYT